MGLQLSSEKSYPVATNVHQSSNILAQKLSGVLGKDHVTSPFSISYIMSLLHAASVDNTEIQISNLMTRKNTLEELLTCSTTFNNDIVKLANIILVNKNMPVKKEYLELVEKLTLVSNEDFSDGSAVVNKANSFIEKSTNGLIKNILETDMISTDTIMVLVNTIYFKAKWAIPFKANNTNTHKFNNSSKVEMMNQTKNHPYYEDSRVQILQLMYKGTEYCMGIILPKESVDIKDCIEYLNKDIVQNPELVEVYIPKFTQRKKIDLIPHMKTLGVTDLFGSESRLDNMISTSGDDFAYVSTMIHEAVVVVDECGTEASAVTVAVCTMECASLNPKKSIVFRADRPFIYYIKHILTNTLLFVGDFHGY